MADARDYVLAEMVNRTSLDPAVDAICEWDLYALWTLAREGGRLPEFVRRLEYRPPGDREGEFADFVEELLEEGILGDRVEDTPFGSVFSSGPGFLAEAVDFIIGRLFSPEADLAAGAKLAVLTAFEKALKATGRFGMPEAYLVVSYGIDLLSSGKVSLMGLLLEDPVALVVARAAFRGGWCLLQTDHPLAFRLNASLLETAVERSPLLLAAIEGFLEPETRKALLLWAANFANSLADASPGADPLLALKLSRFVMELAEGPGDERADIRLLAVSALARACGALSQGPPVLGERALHLLTEAVEAAEESEPGIRQAARLLVWPEVADELPLWPEEDVPPEVEEALRAVEKDIFGSARGGDVRERAVAVAKALAEKAEEILRSLPPEARKLLPPKKFAKTRAAMAAVAESRLAAAAGEWERASEAYGRAAILWEEAGDPLLAFVFRFKSHAAAYCGGLETAENVYKATQDILRNVSLSPGAVPRAISVSLASAAKVLSAITGRKPQADVLAFLREESLWRDRDLAGEGWPGLLAVAVSALAKAGARGKGGRRRTKPPSWLLETLALAHRTYSGTSIGYISGMLRSLLKGRRAEARRMAEMAASEAAYPPGMRALFRAAAEAMRRRGRWAVLRALAKLILHHY